MVQLGFKLPSYGQQPKKKEEEQMMSKAPMMSVAPKAPVISQQTQTSSRTSDIPREPMMSYEIEGTIMPGVSDKTAKNLQNYVKSNAKTPEEQKLLMSDMYQEAIKVQQRKAYEKDREKMKAEMVKRTLSVSDPEEKKQIKTTIQLANLADIIREGAKKQGIDAWDMNDKDLVAGFGENNPDKQQIIVDYLNGKIDSVELGKQIGAIPQEEVPVEETTEEEGSTIKNIGEGMASFAGGIPKVIASTGLLDKGMQNMRESGLGDVMRKVAGKVFGEENLKEFQDANAGKTYSEIAGGSQVGGNTESKVAKNVERGMDVASIVGALPAIIKGGAKIATKQIAKNAAKKVVKSKGVIKEIISEPETVKTVQRALKEGRLEEGATGWVKRILFGEKGAVIKPTKQIEEATDIIVKNIDKPAKTPSKLYTQLIDFVLEKSKTLSSKLKNIQIGTMTKAKSEIKRTIKELATITDEFTESELKKIKSVIPRIDKAKNLDELWNIRKEYDDLFTDTVKQGYGKSGTVGKAHKLWKTGRNILNDKIDEIAETVGDISTKNEFKEMSAILKSASNIYEKAGTKMLKQTKGIINKANVIKAGATAVGLKILGSNVLD